MHRKSVHGFDELADVLRVLLQTAHELIRRDQRSRRKRHRVDIPPQPTNPKFPSRPTAKLEPNVFLINSTQIETY